MPVVSAPRLRLWPPKSRRPKPASTARDWTIAATVRGVIAVAPIRGRGGAGARRLRPADVGRGGSQIRRNTGPSVMPAASSQAVQRTHRAELGVAIGQGDDHRVVLRTLGLRQGQAQAALGLLQLLDADRRQLRAAQRAGEADQKQRAIAQAAQVGRDRRQEAAQDAGGRRDLLARQLALAGGVAPDAGQRLGDADIVGRHRAAGGAVQIADGGPAQFQGFRREVSPALAGQEGGDVGAGGGQGREVSLRAPGAPGAHGGAVGAPRVLGLGHAGIGLGGVALGGQRAVQHRRLGLDDRVEPGLDPRRIGADRRRHQGARRRQQRRRVVRRPVLLARFGCPRASSGPANRPTGRFSTPNDPTIDNPNYRE